MSHNSDLDAAIRRARHLIFAFDGPIHNVDSGSPADSNTATAAYIHEALAACRESGRSAVVITSKPPIDVPAYLDAHDLFKLVTLIAVSVTDAATELEASPTDFLLIASSPIDIKAAREAGAPSIGYARTPDEAAYLIDAGAIMFVYSLADVALTLRAQLSE